MRRPLGVVFDLGDTVLSLDSIDGVAGDRRLLEFADDAAGLTAEDLNLAAEELGRETMRLSDESMRQQTWQSFNRLLCETLGITFTVGYAELEREFWNTAMTFVPCEGIYGVLDTLERNHIKTGILSNTSMTGRVLEEELAKHNLAHRFSFVISSADYGFRKPHSRIFQVAVRKMDLEPRDIWFVGDKLEYDIKGAIDSGLYPVWYNPQGKPNDAGYECLEVRSWYELANKVGALCSH
ncbi:MAG: HAD family hydrolase [Dehalococcoidales bacterium]|nr:HAD family hydrolase [Dehalococcoidales bacterium]